MMSLKRALPLSATLLCVAIAPILSRADDKFDVAKWGRTTLQEARDRVSDQMPDEIRQLEPRVTVARSTEGAIVEAVWSPWESTRIVVGELSPENERQAAEETVALIAAETEELLDRRKVSEQLAQVSRPTINPGSLDLPSLGISAGGGIGGSARQMYYTAWVKLPGIAGKDMFDISKDNVQYVRVVLNSEGAVYSDSGREVQVLRASATFAELYEDARGFGAWVSRRLGILGLQGNVALGGGRDGQVRVDVNALEYKFDLGVRLTRKLAVVLSAGVSMGLRVLDKTLARQKEIILANFRATGALGLLIGDRLYVGAGAEGEFHDKDSGGKHGSLFGVAKWRVARKLTLQGTVSHLLDNNDVLDVRPLGTSGMSTLQVHF